MGDIGNRLGLAAAILGSCAIPTAGKAAIECQPFQLVSDGSERLVEYLDYGPEGPSHADVRHGVRSLTNENGEKVGEYRWTVTSLAGRPGDADVIAHRGAFILGDGDIHWQYYTGRRNPAHHTDKVSVADLTAVIAGGTGAFAFARGTVDVVFDGLKATYDLNIRCD